LQFEALLSAARESPNPNDFALVAMLGLLGLRIFEATGSNICDLGEEHGHRVVRVLGKGSRVVLVPLPPAISRAIERAISDRVSGPILFNTRGVRMDRHAATRRLTTEIGVSDCRAACRLQKLEIGVKRWDRFRALIGRHRTRPADGGPPTDWESLMEPITTAAAMIVGGTRLVTVAERVATRRVSERERRIMVTQSSDLPPGSELREVDADGSYWWIRVGAATNG
jgi:integrase